MQKVFSLWLPYQIGNICQRHLQPRQMLKGLLTLLYTVGTFGAGVLKPDSAGVVAELDKLAGDVTAQAEDPRSKQAKLRAA